MLEREAAPAERSKILIQVEPKHQVTTELMKVAVVYYLSRNGQLEHPHLMEVPISSPQGILCLRDVMNRLSFLRGQGMANMYSWSTKRSYKNGFVWQDLTENDFIYPSNGHEYVLKGTQLIEPSLRFQSPSYEAISTPSSKSSSETNNSSTDADSPATNMGRNQSLLSGYKLYKAKTFKEFSGKAANNASTQTEEKCKQKILLERKQEREGNDDDDDAREVTENSNVGSLPFSSSSFGSLDEGYSVEGYVYGSADIRNYKLENERPSGRMRASAVLMQFIRCRSS